MVTRRQFVADCETTSLVPDYPRGTGVIWEVALIERHPGGERTEYLWRPEPDPEHIAKASPQSLTVGRFYERTGKMKHRDTLAHDIARTPPGRVAYWSHPDALAAVLAPLLNDATLICSVPTFDTGFMAAFLRHYGQAPTWHYRVRDFASIAYGWLRGYDYGVQTEALKPEFGGRTRPFEGRCRDLSAGTDDFAAALGLDLGAYDRHTALGDCRLVADGLDVVEGLL